MEFLTHWVHDFPHVTLKVLSGSKMHVRDRHSTHDVKDMSIRLPQEAFEEQLLLYTMQGTIYKSSEHVSFYLSLIILHKYRNILQCEVTDSWKSLESSHD